MFAVAPVLAVGDAGQKWSGSAALNFNLIESVSDSESFTLSGRGEKASARDRFTLNALFAYGRQRSPGASNVTEDRYRFQGQYDQQFKDLYFWYLSTRQDRDKIVQLNLRSVYSGGLGYRIFRRSDLRWLVSTGISYRREDYQSSPDGEEYGLRFGSELRRELNSWITVTHDLELIPAFQDFGDYVLSSDLRVLTRLNSRIAAEVRYIFDFDSTPAGAGRKDTNKYFFGLGYQF